MEKFVVKSAAPGNVFYLIGTARCAVRLLRR
jgi:hypothetical protein